MIEKVEVSIQLPVSSLRDRGHATAKWVGQVAGEQFVRRTADVLILLVAGGLVALFGFWSPARSALMDLLTARTYVWVLFAAVAGALGLASVAMVLQRRRSGRAGSGAARPRIGEVRHLGVLWRIQWELYGGYEYRPCPGMPRCLKDKAELGWCMVDNHKPEPLVGSIADLVKKMPATRLQFKCFTCDQEYNLETPQGYTLQETMDIVAARAKGDPAAG